jgi:tetratricopeptide (TPR) repeat protein
MTSRNDASRPGGCRLASRFPHPERARTGRVIWLALIIPVVVIVGVAITYALVRPAPAARAARRGWSRLDEGDTDAAVRLFEEAIRLDPRTEDAWHGLLQARPDATIARRFARHHPELFDPLQPLQAPQMLVRPRGWDGRNWERSLEVYEQVALADRAPELLRMDFLGRKQVTEAWRHVREVRNTLDLRSRQPLDRDTLDAFNRFQLDRARVIVREAVSSLEDSNVYFQLVQSIDLAVRREREGLAKLRKAEAADPNFVPTQLTLAYVEIGRGQPDRARDRCIKLLSSRSGQGLVPGEVRVRYCLARAFELLGEPESALEQIELVVQRGRTVPGLLRLGILYLETGQIDKAEAIADELLAGTTKDTRSSYLKGLSSLYRRRYPLAVIELTKAQELAPADGRILYQRARAYLGMQKYQLASRDFLEAVELLKEPEWAGAAGAACALGAYDAQLASQAAGALLSGSSRLRPDRVVGGYARRFQLAARALIGEPGRLEKALAELQSAAAGKPVDDYLIAAVFAGRAFTEANAELQLPKAAFEYFREAAAKRSSAAYSLAFLHAVSGHTDAACTELGRLVEAHPDHLLGRLFLARLHVIGGRTEDAARLLRPVDRPGAPEAVAATLRLIDELQGITPSSGGGDSADHPAGHRPAPPPAGPHDMYFSIATYVDGTRMARALVLLDPVSEQPRRALHLTYNRVRRSGLDGVAEAAKADDAIRVTLEREAGRYAGDHERMYRAVIGAFWQRLPQNL